MTVTLTPELESLVQQKLASGLYHSPDEVVREALQLLTQQDSLPHLSTDESKLMLAINQGLSSAERSRFNELIGKRRDELIAPDEHRELLNLTEKSELFNAERMAALIRLSQMRGTTLNALMRQLGIKTPDVLG